MPLTAHSSAAKDKRTAKHGVELQHRHFSFIANVIATSGEREEDKRRWAHYFAFDCARSNPRFDRARFFKVCGVDDPHA